MDKGSGGVRLREERAALRQIRGDQRGQPVVMESTIDAHVPSCCHRTRGVAKRDLALTGGVLAADGVSSRVTVLDGVRLNRCARTSEGLRADVWQVQRASREQSDP